MICTLFTGHESVTVRRVLWKYEPALLDAEKQGAVMLLTLEDLY